MIYIKYLKNGEDSHLSSLYYLSHGYIYPNGSVEFLLDDKTAKSEDFISKICDSYSITSDRTVRGIIRRQYDYYPMELYFTRESNKNFLYDNYGVVTPYYYSKHQELKSKLGEFKNSLPTYDHLIDLKRNYSYNTNLDHITQINIIRAFSEDNENRKVQFSKLRLVLETQVGEDKTDAVKVCKFLECLDPEDDGYIFITAIKEIIFAGIKASPYDIKISSLEACMFHDKNWEFLSDKSIYNISKSYGFTGPTNRESMVTFILTAQLNVMREISLKGIKKYPAFKNGLKNLVAFTYEK